MITLKTKKFVKRPVAICGLMALVLLTPEPIGGVRGVIDRLTPADGGTFCTHEGVRMPW